MRKRCWLWTSSCSARCASTFGWRKQKAAMKRNCGLTKRSGRWLGGLVNNEYDPFARLYNRHWGVDYRSEALPIVERLLLARLKPGARGRDGCGGHGQFT